MSKDTVHDRPLAGKRAVITGGGRGIGAAIASELVRLGCGVVLLGRTLGDLERHCAEIEASFGLAAAAHVLDVTDADAVADFFSTSVSEPAPLILVNNAGVAPAAAFEKYDDAAWRTAFDVNVMGAVHCSKAVLPAMREAGWGRIVNVASTAGLVAYKHAAAYVASKHALVGLTRALGLELAKTGITVNAVCPGYTETEIAAQAIRNIMAGTGRGEDEARALLTRPNPQERLVTPAEVAAAVGQLCLPSASAMVGQTITVAGGEVM